MEGPSSKEQVMVKNLDTGEMVRLSDMMGNQLPPKHPNKIDSEGSQKKKWFATGKKITKWAKNHIPHRTHKSDRNEQNDASEHLREEGTSVDGAGHAESEGEATVSTGEGTIEASREQSLHNFPGFDGDAASNSSEVESLYSDDDEDEGHGAKHTPRASSFTQIMASGLHGTSELLKQATKLNGAIKVYNRNKNFRNITQVKLIQEIHAHDGVIWSMRYSRDNRFLATAGQDGVVRVWDLTLRRQSLDATAVPPSPSTSTSTPAPLSPLLDSAPIVHFFGHTEDVVDISWSRHRFILSASMDKTVRLWHLPDPNCLRVFKHNDHVSCVTFHPTDPKRFVSGTLDGRIHVWSVSDTKELCSTVVPHDSISVITFSLDSARVIAGTVRGKCRLYHYSETKLDFIAQIDVRNSTGKYAPPRKVTSLVPVPGFTDRYIISSNDSRIRMFSGFSQERKYKGYKNTKTQVQAWVSSDAAFIVSGSDNGWVYVWPTSPPANEMRMRQATQVVKSKLFDSFNAGESTVVVAMMAPPELWRRSTSSLPAASQPPTPTPPQKRYSVGGMPSSQAMLKAATTSDLAIASDVKSPLSGAVFIVGGFSGRILVFENA